VRLPDGSSIDDKICAIEANALASVIDVDLDIVDNMVSIEAAHAWANALELLLALIAGESGLVGWWTASIGQRRSALARSCSR